MRAILFGAALATMASSAWAQTSGPDRSDQVTVPSAQNSGAGIPGQPGGKSGVTTGRSSTTDPVGSDQDNAVRLQDASKIPGKPGSESGPAVKSPDGSQK
jgi:hypothetical protein